MSSYIDMSCIITNSAAVDDGTVAYGPVKLYRLSALHLASNAPFFSAEQPPADDMTYVKASYTPPHAQCSEAKLAFCLSKSCEKKSML